MTGGTRDNVLHYLVVDDVNPLLRFGTQSATPGRLSRSPALVQSLSEIKLGPYVFNGPLILDMSHCPDQPRIASMGDRPVKGDPWVIGRPIANNRSRKNIEDTTAKYLLYVYRVSTNVVSSGARKRQLKWNSAMYGLN